MAVTDTDTDKLLRRFRAKFVVDETSGCHVWIASLNLHGYGRFHRSGTPRGNQAHRIAYELLNGPVPEGLELDHLCRNRACVNPEHLEPVTHAENIRRGYQAAGRARPKRITRPRPPSDRAECSRGHPYSSENTYVRHRKGLVIKECMTCRREHVRKFRAANAAT